ncbi:MAG: hypothetical protein KC468_09270, partial [Myxococcales bacterium]|nr:hypothetical protein [Myxococcales bacterium]
HLEPDDPVGAWLLATSHERAGRLEAAAIELRRLLELDPGAELPMTRLCELELRRHRWTDALELADALVRRREPGPSDWDRMTAATALGRWELVRDSCARLGIELDEPAGPIDEDWGSCRIEFEDDAGRPRWARRTGPVTARVSEICGPGAARERHRELVLFDPAPVTRELEGPAGRALCTYRSLAVLEPGARRSFTLDGAAPDEARVQALASALRRFDLTLQRRSGDGYTFQDSEDDATHKGAYFFCSVPASTELAALHAALRDATVDWPSPTVWIELAEALGDAHAEERQRQRALVQRYGL